MDPTQSSSVSLFYNPDRVIKKFEEFFSHSKNQAHIDDLYYLFGAVNFARIQSCLRPSLQNKMGQRSSDIEGRFRIIWGQFLNSLLNQTTISPNLIEKARLYQNSAFGGVNLRELMIQELSRYFLSRPMPLQESKIFDCYEIRAIKEDVNKHVVDLRRIVDVLFRLGARRMDPALQELTQLDYCIMFRSAALIFQSKEYSWGQLVYYWAETNGNAVVVSTIQNSFALEKLFISTEDGLALMPQENFTLSFKQFVIESTLYLFFKSPIAPLPDVEVIQQDLQEAFANASSDEERGNSVYYVNSVFLWFEKFDKKFLFAAAQKALQSLHRTQDGCVYNFLHAVLHYFHALSALKVMNSTACKKMLFEAIYAVPLKKRKIFDKKIVGETYFQSGYLVDEYTVSFIRAHHVTLVKWGEAFLRFSQSSSTSSPDLYLSAKEHLILLQKLEDFIGLSLPEDVIADLFFFQKIKKGALELVVSLEALRQTILNNYLETLSISKGSLSTLQNLFKAFVEQFQSPALIFEDQTDEYKNRNDRFLRNASQLTSILQMMMNPKSFVLLEDLIPESIEMLGDKSLFVKMDDAGNHANERLQLINPNYPTGPLWMSRWQTKGRDIYCSISIINSLQRMHTCTFWLKVPSEPIGHLSLIKQHVDTNTSIEFVRVVRTLFLKSFYRVMLGSQAPKAVFVPELAMLYPFEDSQYDSFLSKIFAEWKASSDEEFIRESILLSDDLLSLRIDTERVLAEQEDEAEETLWINWTLYVDGVDYISKLKYAQFEDEEAFIRMMVWQIALLKQDHQIFQ